MNELVSVIIPTYGGGNMLRRSINSVLNQTYAEVEVLVVDDNGVGTPNQVKTSEEISRYADDPRVVYICHDVNRNGSAARNTGFARSKGTYITLLDDDDEYMPEKIERQVHNLKKHQECGLTYCRRDMYVNNKFQSTKHAIQSDNYIFDLMTHKVGISSGTLMVRRSVWEQVHGFDESFRRHQDYEFTVRVAAVTGIYPDDFLGLKKNMEGRNNPGSVMRSFEYRHHYITKLEKYLKSLTEKEQRIVLETNYLDIAIEALKNKDFSSFCKIYSRSKVGPHGLYYIVKRIMKFIQ